MPKITINGQVVKAKSGQTILQAAYENGVEIPTLCYLKEINEIGFCRMCVVEVSTSKDLVTACDTPVEKGMVINTSTNKVVDSRKSSLSLLANKHKFNCWTCTRGDGSCDFYNLLKDYHVREDMFGNATGRFPDVIGGLAINLDEQKCVLCKRCVATCSSVVTAKALKFRDDDPMNPIVSPTPGLDFDESGCISCGECTLVCPTGALIETPHIEQVERALRDSNKYVVAQVDPAIKGALGESFAREVGEGITDVDALISSSLTALGFDEVVDLSAAADLLMVEQAKEFVDRVENDGAFPMFTASSPGWIRYIEQYQPDHLDKLVPLKSPHLIGAELFTKLNKVDKELYIVSISPSTATKYEVARSEYNGQIDAVLTTKEFARLIDKQRVNFDSLEPTEVDKYGGYGEMFGAVGAELVGTMAQVAKTLNNEDLTSLKLDQVTSFDKDLIETTVQIGGNKFNVAVVHGGRGMKQLFEAINSGKKQYHLVEVSETFGGLLNGGGQPRVAEEYILGTPVAKLRNESYVIEPKLSEDNPQVKAWYKELLESPGSAAAHKHLHTKFSRKAFRRE